MNSCSTAVSKISKVAKRYQSSTASLHCAFRKPPPPKPNEFVIASCRREIPLHDGAGDGDTAALVSVALNAFGLAARGLGGLDDAVDDGGGGAARAVAVDETRGS